MIDPLIGDRAAEDLARLGTQWIDVLYREWSRRRSDDEALRQLHDAIGEYLCRASTH